jgi:hypothetical protein
MKIELIKTIIQLAMKKLLLTHTDGFCKLQIIKKYQ